MNVLGITDGITCGAAAIQDGRLRAAVNEERIVRKKMAYGFPSQAIGEVLRLSGWSPKDVDRVAVATRDNYFSPGIREWTGWFEGRRDGTLRGTIFDLASVLGSGGNVPALKSLYFKTRAPIFAQRRARIAGVLRNDFGIPPRPSFVNHHYAHAAGRRWAPGS